MSESKWLTRCAQSGKSRKMMLYRYISNEPNWPFVRSNELGGSDATKLPSSGAVDQFEIGAARSVTPLKNGV